MKKSDLQKMYEELGNYCNDPHIIPGSEEKFEIVTEFLFRPDFAGFRGHFPGRPVLPAVVQFLMVRFVSERALGLKLVPRGYRRTKFTGVVQPGDGLTMRLRLEKSNGNWVCNFTHTLRDGSKVSSGEATFSI